MPEQFVWLIFLLPLILSEIQAQQTATFPSTAARSAAISIETLKSRQLAIESMTDIDDTVKTDSLRYIDRAIKDLGLADNNAVLGSGYLHHTFTHDHIYTK